jgi:hypothetical protein
VRTGDKCASTIILKENHQALKGSGQRSRNLGNGSNGELIRSENNNFVPPPASSVYFAHLSLARL